MQKTKIFLKKLNFDLVISLILYFFLKSFNEYLDLKNQIETKVLTQPHF